MSKVEQLNLFEAIYKPAPGLVFLVVRQTVLSWLEQHRADSPFYRYLMNVKRVWKLQQPNADAQEQLYLFEMPPVAQVEGVYQLAQVENWLALETKVRRIHNRTRDRRKAKK